MKAGSANDRVRFGMIGVGGQGSSLLGQAVELHGAECAAASDVYDGRLTLAREIAGDKLPVTRRYQELLDNKEIDCIVAALPDHWHRRIALEVLSAGKDLYLEKPMSYSLAEGYEIVDAARKSGRILQVGSQRVDSQLFLKARELYQQGAIGQVSLVENWLGRNDPTGAWQYPIPADLSPSTVDWDTWLGDRPKRPFDPALYARWRLWKEFGTGIAGDLMVHSVTGIVFVLGMNEPPRTAYSQGGIFRWKDGRDFPDVHSVLFRYGHIPVVVNITFNGEMPETTRFFGSKGILEITEFALTCTPQPGTEVEPSYYADSFPKKIREDYQDQWHKAHDPRPGKETILETQTFRGPSFDSETPHLANFFHAVRTRQPVLEDAAFGNNMAIACHMANQSYFEGTPVSFDPGSKRIASRAGA
ncbi:MAG TPA: Gfo/Idh/MocA family oxidoreductase [Terriglobales bacterium]|nr:Gfo/Idh/MocA family oxidoreductase [Terriglobales bacterium]